MIRRYSALFVFIFSLAAALLVARLYIPRAIIGWDEAHYLTNIYTMTHAVSEGDWKNVWTLSRAQFTPPPMQSLLLSIPLSIIGYSHMNARMVGLIFFIIAAMGIYVLGRMTDRKYGEIVGLAASLLFLSAPFVLFITSLAVMETLGAAVSVITVILYVVARKKMKAYWFILVGITLTCTLLVKFNFGLLVGAGLGIESVYWFFTNKRNMSVVYYTVIMVVLPVLFLMWWVLTPYDRSAVFLEFLQNDDYTVQLAPYGSINQLLFYPRAILYSYSVSPWIGYILLVSGVAALGFWKNMVLRVSWCIFTVNFILGTFFRSSTLLERYILTTIPFLYITSAYCVVRTVDWCKKRWNKHIFAGICWGAFIIFAVVTIPDIVRLPEYVYAVGTYTLKSAVFNQKDYRDLWFDYDRRKWFYHIPVAPFEQPKDVIEYILSVTDPNKPMQVFGYTTELSSWYIELEQALAKATHSSKNDGYTSYVAVIRIQSSSRLNTRDLEHYNESHPWNVAPSVPHVSWHQIGQQSFKDLGVDVSIYGI